MPIRDVLRRPGAGTTERSKESARAVELATKCGDRLVDRAFSTLAAEACATGAGTESLLTPSRNRRATRLTMPLRNRTCGLWRAFGSLTGHYYVRTVERRRGDATGRSVVSGRCVGADTAAEGDGVPGRALGRSAQIGPGARRGGANGSGGADMVVVARPTRRWCGGRARGRRSTRPACMPA